MDNLENNPPAQPEAEPFPTRHDSPPGVRTPAVADLDGREPWLTHYDSLRRLAISMLVLLIIISGTLNFFLLRQATSSRQDLDVTRQQVDAFMAQYQQNVAPAMDEFLRKLSEFGRTNPDFKPILDRHLSNPAAPGPTPAPAPAPTAPATPAAPAKAPKK